MAHFYQKAWFIILMLFVFAPLGIGLLWWHKRSWTIVSKVIATAIAGLLFISIASPNSADPNVSQETIRLAVRSITSTAGSATTVTPEVIETTEDETAVSSTTQKQVAISESIKPTTSATTDKSIPSSEMKVHFLDVGQGAATLIQIGEKVMIIDGGDRDKSSFVVAYLKKLGIEQVDVMIATHYDSDHLNGLVGVLNVFPVKQVYDANYATDTRVFNSFKTYIRDHNVPEAVPGMKQSIQVGDAAVTFIAPKQYGHSTGNDDSICIRVQFGEKSFVIMGDPSADAEQQILTQNLDSDVFYASHHGSNGSNSKTLLANVSPSFVVISCGANNSYGHPGDNTLNRIRNTGSQLYRTDKQGTIIATSDGSTISWSQEPCNDFTTGVVTAETTTAITKATTIVATTIPAATVSAIQTYVLNTNSMKFHYPACSSAAAISPTNRQDVTLNRAEIIGMGYVPCMRCNP